MEVAEVNRNSSQTIPMGFCAMASERLGDGPQELLLGTHCCAADEGHKEFASSLLSFFIVSPIVLQRFQDQRKSHVHRRHGLLSGNFDCRSYNPYKEPAPSIDQMCNVSPARTNRQSELNDSLTIFDVAVRVQVITNHTFD